MCGIAGLLDADVDGGTLDDLARRMADSLRHRGPDSSGVWTDSAAAVGLSHRRLAVIDPTPGGHQPMSTADGRVVLTFNGEIYNWRDVRRRLEQAGVRFRSDSDTEVLLEGIARWGLARTLQACVGMFALAVWDRDRRTLSLARDRLGEKPLYHGWIDGRFVFGSELHAIRCAANRPLRISRAAVGALLRWGHVPAPWSIYEGIEKLPPGSILEVRVGDAGPAATPLRYWSLADVAASAPLDIDRHTAVARLREGLTASVAGQMLADVDVGAFLSGGIDSSLVVATMQSLSPTPVRTFTIGFEDKGADGAGFDEAPFAREVACRLGTDHTELYMTPAEVRDTVPRLPGIYDEPFADSSQLPTVLIAELAQRHVTVALSGDGGDELFAGYDRYAAHERWWEFASRIPYPARRLLGVGLTALPGDRVDAWGARLPTTLRRSNLGDKVRKAGLMVRARDPREGWEALTSLWTDPAAVVGPEGWRRPPAHAIPARLSEIERAMFLDAVIYLPDDILTKVDRAAMATSLETRVPLLDHRVVELAWQLPMSVRRAGGVSKWPLRQLLATHLPLEMFDRPKAGFGVPLDAWLRGPLREWASDLLAPDRLRAEGWLDAAAVADRWQAHLSGAADHRHALWAVLMFQSWLAEHHP